MRQKHWWIAGLLATVVVHAVVLVLLPEDGSLVEAVYARRVYPIVGPIVAFVPSLVPFSVVAVLIIGLIIWVPGLLVVNLIRWRRGQHSLGQAAAGTALAYAVVGAIAFHSFYLFWGYNYLRPPLEQRLGLPGEAISADSRSAFAREFVAGTNAAWVPIEVWDRQELERLIDGAVARAVQSLEGRAPVVVSPLKSDLDTGFFAWQGFRGVVSPHTLEAHVDFRLSPWVVPFTAAHEKAHLAGFARERDANFVAWLALTRADDLRLRYAGHFGVLTYFLNSVSRMELSEAVQADRAAAAQYSARRVSPRVRDARQQVYSVYLRANRMPAGRADYSQVWQLIQAWEAR